LVFWDIRLLPPLIYVTIKVVSIILVLHCLQPSPAPPSGPVSSIDMLPQSIRTVDPPASQTGKRGGRKRPAPVADVPEPKKFASAPQPAPPVPEEQIVLDTYYYATLEGDAVIVKEEFKNSLTVKVRKL